MPLFTTAACFFLFFFPSFFPFFFCPRRHICFVRRLFTVHLFVCRFSSALFVLLFGCLSSFFRSGRIIYSFMQFLSLPFRPFILSASYFSSVYLSSHSYFRPGFFFVNFFMIFFVSFFCPCMLYAGALHSLLKFFFSFAAG